MKYVCHGVFPSFNHNLLPFTSFHITSLHFTSLHFTSLRWSPLNFALFITFLILFLKLLGLKERVPKTSACSWFQSWIVLFTKEYFPMSVLFLLLLIFLSWSTLFRWHGLSYRSPIASQACSPVYALHREHMRDISLRCVNVCQFESFLWCANLAAVFCNRSSAFIYPFL
jgi:hypothetical protein